MNKLSLCLIIICALSGYTLYNRYVVQPNKATAASEKMLAQIAIKERWFNGLKVMEEVSNGKGSLERQISFTSKVGNEVRSSGKIKYTNASMNLCKIVEFSFILGSLNDYQIQSAYDCVK